MRAAVYNSKSWLLRVAGEVDARAELYQAQLARCGLTSLSDRVALLARPDC